MSPLDRPAPPAGEEIHLPGPSIQPVLLAVFIAVALVGVTISWILTIAGGIGIVAVIVRWVADTRRDIAELPLHHDEH
jgi:hypothetical protein